MHSRSTLCKHVQYLNIQHTVVSLVTLEFFFLVSCFSDPFSDHVAPHSTAGIIYLWLTSTQSFFYSGVWLLGPRWSSRCTTSTRSNTASISDRHLSSPHNALHVLCCGMVSQTSLGWFLSEEKFVWLSLGLAIDRNVDQLQSNLSLRPPWQKRPPENCGHAFSVPSILGFKCTECVLENATTWEMRIADTVCGPKASIQPGKSDQIRQIERKTLFRSSNVSLAGTPDKRSSRLQARRLGMVVANYAPRACGNYRSLMAMAPAGACLRLYIENFWTKPGKWDHLRNRTTYSQSLRWS